MSSLRNSLLRLLAPALRCAPLLLLLLSGSCGEVAVDDDSAHVTWRASDTVALPPDTITLMRDTVIIRRDTVVRDSLRTDTLRVYDTVRIHTRTGVRSGTIRTTVLGRTMTMPITVDTSATILSVSLRNNVPSRIDLRMSAAFPQTPQCTTKVWRGYPYSAYDSVSVYVMPKWTQLVVYDCVASPGWFKVFQVDPLLSDTLRNSGMGILYHIWGSTDTRWLYTNNIYSKATFKVLGVDTGTRSIDAMATGFFAAGLYPPGTVYVDTLRLNLGY